MEDCPHARIEPTDCPEMTTDEIIYVASSNAGKLRDFAAAAAVFGVAIAELPGLAQVAPPPEDGATFEANAREKALAYSHVRPGLLVLMMGKQRLHCMRR